MLFKYVKYHHLNITTHTKKKNCKELSNDHSHTVWTQLFLSLKSFFHKVLSKTMCSGCHIGFLITKIHVSVNFEQEHTTNFFIGSVITKNQNKLIKHFHMILVG